MKGEVFSVTAARQLPHGQ